MKPFDQTDYGFETGNCGEACIASILEIPLQDIPNFHNPDDHSDGNYYCKKIREFLYQFGYSYIDVELRCGNAPIEYFKDCWVIASGLSPRGTEDSHRHAVVWRNGEIVHDPHPSREGLKEIEMYGIFIQREPKANGNG